VRAHRERTKDLLDQRRLADLPRAGEHLHESAWSHEPVVKERSLRSLVGHGPSTITHVTE
jgi:hypothetical protein